MHELTRLLLKLNLLIDADYADDVTPEEIDAHLETGDLLDWLESKFWGHFRLDVKPNLREAIVKTLHSVRQEAKAREGLPHPKDRAQVVAWVRSPASDSVAVSRPVEWEPHHNGICVLISCIGQAILRHTEREQQPRASRSS